MPNFTSRLSPLDWSIVFLYLAGMLTIGLAMSRRAGRSLDEFFVSGRRLTWWLAGASLIATSFASDTPLWVSGLVRRFGVHAAWQYWAPAIGGGVGVFLFSGLWRRLGVLTDIEFTEIRYAGKSAAFLRGLNAFWTSLLLNALIMGWVTKAMENILSETLGIHSADKAIAVGIAISIALVYCALSGLWGVVLTDFVQLVIATFGTIMLAAFSVQAVGGLDVLIAKLQALPDWPGTQLAIGPRIGEGPGFLSIWNALAFGLLLWWTVALTNNYNAQRLLATKDERHASFANLTYIVVYWGINAWPWIVVALCSLILLPGFDAGPAQETAYPRMMMTYLPNGLRGLMFVAMLAAFMSTISTLINWGSSYFVNDFYRRFIVRDRGDRHYVAVGRAVSVLMAILGGTVAYLADSIQVLIQVGLMLMGTSAFLVVMRWFWWRMNALSEIAGFLACILTTVAMLVFHAFDGPARLVLGAVNPDGSPLVFHSDYAYFGLRNILMFGVTVAVTVIAALCTKPETNEVLASFVRRAKPPALLWKPVITGSDIEYGETIRLREVFVGWIAVMVAVYGIMYSIGSFIFLRPLAGCISGAAGLAALVWTIRRINRRYGSETRS